MPKLRHGSLFSGIGGFDLAAEWMGWENVFHCEWNDFGKKILKYYWPNSISYDDITKTDFTIHRGKIDILTGGFPCQPFSAAGVRRGKDDERYLWPEMLRAIREIQPRWIVGENVYGLVNWSGGLVFHEVQVDLEAEGYEVQPFLLPAVSVGAPHRRDRIWFVAYASDIRRNAGGAKQSLSGYSTDGTKTNATNPNGNTKRPSGKSGGIESNRGENIIQPSQWGSETELNNRPSSVPRPTTNTNDNGFNGSNGQHEVNASEGREYALGDIEQMGGDVADTDMSRCGQGNEENERRTSKQSDGDSFQSNAADTSNTGLERGKVGGSIGGSRSQQNELTSRCFRTDWSKFPTQSPICHGDDGLSDRLDGITFPKWRQESIKGGGNAVVPQVVYQIFKTIDEYDRSTDPAAIDH